jgi:hypothetical protein
MIMRADEFIVEIIQKRGNEWCVISKKKNAQGHHQNLGCYTSRASARKRLGQVEYFKHLKEAGPEEI